MKTVMGVLLFVMSAFVSTFVMAQYPQGVSEADMQKMMMQMQEMQACMQTIDQSELKALEKRSMQFESDVKAMCSRGESSKALAKAMEFSKEVTNSPAMKTLRKCTEGLQETMASMKSMMPPMPLLDKDYDYTKHDVCDGMK